MSSVSPAGRRSPGTVIVLVILVIIALLAIIAGVLYFAEPAKSLPSVLGTITHPASRANTDRPLRGAVALIVGVILLVAAWFVGRLRPSSRR